MPWGLIPALRLGSRFRDGEITSDAAFGDIYTVDIPIDADHSILEARSCVSGRQYSLKTKKNLDEMCVVIDVAGRKVIVPCLEAIRYYFALNRNLADQLLDPTFLLGMLHFEPIPDGGLRIRFRDSVPDRSLTQAVIYTIAALICDGNWASTWRSISILRLMKVRQGIEEPPLECLPPLFRGYTWNVRGIQDISGNLLVLEILSDSCPPELAPQLPDKIIYVCEGSRPAGSSEQSSSGDRLRISKPSVVEIDPSGRPTEMSQPIEIEARAPGHQYGALPEIEEEWPKWAREGQGTDGVSKGLVGTRRDSRPVKGTLGEQDGQGDTASAEFISLTENTEAPEPFRDFFDALRAMQKHEPQLRIEHAFCPIPGRSALAWILGRQRQYALVKISNGTKEAYILEPDISDGHTISTLILVPRVAGLEPQSVADSILRDCVTSDGSWSVRRLKEKREVNVDLAKHTSPNPEIWGQRLLHKAKALHDGMRRTS